MNIDGNEIICIKNEMIRDYHANGCNYKVNEALTSLVKEFTKKFMMNCF